MKHTTIGHLPADSGADWYYLLELEESDGTPEWPEEYARSHFLASVYRNTFTPGGVYCSTVRVTPYPYSETKFIGIAEVRYDV